MKNSRRGWIIELLRTRMSDEEILVVLEREFPSGVFKTSNRQALSGTKWDLRSSGKRKPVHKFSQTP
jgi:hypothetical protein